MKHVSRMTIVVDPPFYRKASDILSTFMNMDYFSAGDTKVTIVGDDRIMSEYHIEINNLDDDTVMFIGDILDAALGENVEWGYYAESKACKESRMTITVDNGSAYETARDMLMVMRAERVCDVDNFEEAFDMDGKCFATITIHDISLCNAYVVGRILEAAIKDGIQWMHHETF